MQFTDVAIDRAAEKAVDESLSVQDRVTMAVQSFYKGEREIYQTIDDIAGRARLSTSATYQALFRLAQKGYLEILKDKIGDTGRSKVVGVKINRAPEPETVLNTAVEVAKNHRVMTRRLEPKVAASLVHLNDYMQKKVAIAKARDILMEAGIDAVDVSSAFNNMWQENPIAEEGIRVLSELNETLQAKNELSLRLEANRREEEVTSAAE